MALYSTAVTVLTFGLVRPPGDLPDNYDDHSNDDTTPTRRSSSSFMTGTDGTILHDKYGFYLSDTFHRSLSKSPEEVALRGAKEAQRAEKWIRMKAKWPFILRYRRAKLQRRIRKGIPNALRSWAWTVISDAKTYRDLYPDPSGLDISMVPDKVKEDIEKDVDRTFPKHLQFAENNGSGQTSLRRLLLWYACIDAEVGYCQGMGFIAGLLLTYLEEKEAFYCFAAALMRPAPSPLRLIYLPDLADAKRKLFVFGELGRQHLGALWVHLEDQHMHPTMYATEWLMTMFCRGFCFDLVTRVWDVYLQEGFKIFYRVSLALLKTMEKELMQVTLTLTLTPHP